MEKIRYHVFADNVDELCKTLKEAKAVYKELLSKGYENVRIYKLIGDDEEVYIKGAGSFPY